MIGETEIQGQFKNFIKVESEVRESWIHVHCQLFQSLLADAKDSVEKESTLDYKAILSVLNSEVSEDQILKVLQIVHARATRTQVRPRGVSE